MRKRQVSYKFGDKYGRLTIVGNLQKIGDNKRVIKYVICKCDCGSQRISTITNLRRGLSKSCGCIKGKTTEKHGMSNTPEYFTWHGMIERCKNENNSRYSSYGGRGITVCEKWNNFSGFYEDMGKRPQGTTLDRIDNNKGYSKENCKWSTSFEQQNNRRNTRRIKYKGDKKTIAEWSTFLGIKYNTLSTRIRRGWTIEKSIEKGV